MVSYVTAGEQRGIRADIEQLQYIGENAAKEVQHVHCPTC